MLIAGSVSFYIANNFIVSGNEEFKDILQPKKYLYKVPDMGCKPLLRFRSAIHAWFK